MLLGDAAPLTILDETCLGMDAVARATFYRELLADHLAHPRTIILSTHLIEEVADLLERVIIIDRGRVLLYTETDELRGRGGTVTGPFEWSTPLRPVMSCWASRALGGVRAVALDWRPAPGEVARGEAAGLTFGPVGIQDLFVHLTSRAEAFR